MNYAVKLVYFPQQIFAAAIATVIFPLLATQFARDNRRGVARSMITGLRLVNFITIPSVCVLIVLARPMVQALFERGTFEASATDLTAGLMPYAAVGLVALAANVVLNALLLCVQRNGLAGRDLGRSRDAQRAAVDDLASTLGGRGLLLANSLSQTLQAVLLLLLVSRLVAGIDWRSLGFSAAKIVASSLAMVAALHWIGTLGVTPEPSLASRAWFLFGQLAIGGTVFLAAARMLNVEELELARRTIVAKFERNLVSPPDNREAPIA